MVRFSRLQDLARLCPSWRGDLAVSLQELPSTAAGVVVAIPCADKAVDDPRIVAVRGCVSDTSGNRFLTTDQPAWGNHVSEAPTTCLVPAFTITDLADRYGVRRIDLLKVNVEGEEEKLFGHAEFLRKTKL